MAKLCKRSAIDDTGALQGIALSVLIQHLSNDLQSFLPGILSTVYAISWLNEELRYQGITFRSEWKRCDILGRYNMALSMVGAKMAKVEKLPEKLQR